jgi:protein TonB
MPRRRALACLSVLVHALIFAAIVVTQLFAVGPWPTPRLPLAFEDVRRVQVVDIAQPAVHRPGSTAGAPGIVSPVNAAPIAAPTGVAPETGREGPTAPLNLAGVEPGVDGLYGIGRVDGMPPPPPPPVVPTRLSSGMQPPRKTVDVVPLYPTIARNAHIEGIVILEVVIDARGQVESVRVLKSIQTLDQAAMDAVRQWKFTPTLLSGQPIPIVMTVTVNFQLSR